MTTLIALLTLAGMFSNTGCRSARDNQIDILERELRTQEDYIYELEDYIVDYSEKLRQYRCADMNSIVVSEKEREPDLAPPQRPGTDNTATTSRELRKSAPEPVDDVTPELTEPANDEAVEPAPETLEVPELEIGEPVGIANPYEHATPLIAAELDGVLLDDGSFVPDPSAYQTVAIQQEEQFEEFAADDLVEEDAQPFAEDAVPTRNRDPERLVISHVFSNTDESAEPTSLLSVVEARDASNEPADFNGKVSLMVMTLIDEKPQRLKRWDFTAEETSAAWQSSHLGDGLHLELPLEGMQLPDGALELWVRLETADGRKLLSQIPFEQVSLASIGEAESHVAATDEVIDGATHLADANPLRQERPAIKTEPIQRGPVVTATAAAETNSEPRWRAATHHSQGANTGYATTATAQQWNTRPIAGSPAAKPADEPQSKGQQQQWRARRK